MVLIVVVDLRLLSVLVVVNRFSRGIGLVFFGLVQLFLKLPHSELQVVHLLLLLLSLGNSKSGVALAFFTGDLGQAFEEVVSV